MQLDSIHIYKPTFDLCLGLWGYTDRQYKNDYWKRNQGGVRRGVDSAATWLLLMPLVNRDPFAGAFARGQRRPLVSGSFVVRTNL